MTPEVERLYQEIGNLLVGIPTRSAAGIALYAEAEDGVVSCNVFYLPTGGQSIKMQFGPPELDLSVYELWERWQEVPKNEAWRAMLYTVKGGKFAIDLIYGDRFNQDADVVDRRTSAVRSVLGEHAIDYSEVQPKP